MFDVKAISKMSMVLTLVLVSTFLAGCGGGGASSSAKQGSFYTGGAPGGTPVRGGTVTIDSPEAISSLDPVAPTSQITFNISGSLFDGLTTFLPGNNEPQPNLASWTTSPDGRSYTFRIRQGVKFSNGEQLTGEDVVYSLLRAKNLAISECKQYTTEWRHVSLKGPMTVELQLNKPDPTLSGILTLSCFDIVPKRVVQSESESQFDRHPVGTGPFILKSATPGNTTVTLVRNPHYWRAGEPYLDGLVINQVESDNARILAVRSGAANVALNIPYAQVAGLKATPGARVLIGRMWGASLNAINSSKPPLNEVNVRRALLFATPFAAIIKSVYKGLATQTNSVWGGTKYWDSHVPFYKYDLTKAKALLRTTSVPNGFPLTIQYTSGETIGELTASILQSAWAKIGIHVTISSVESASLFANFLASKYQVVLLPPENGVDVMFDPGPNSLAYLDDEITPSVAPSAHLKAQVEKAVVAQSQAERQKLFQEIQYESYWQEPTWIPMVNLASLSLAGDSVHSFQSLPNGVIPVRQIWLAH
ncbi:MAG: ABC transporter substrate-binding protein [Solirubrobacteraceae bacterium]